MRVWRLLKFLQTSQCCASICFTANPDCTLGDKSASTPRDYVSTLPAVFAITSPQCIKLFDFSKAQKLLKRTHHFLWRSTARHRLRNELLLHVHKVAVQQIQSGVHTGRIIVISTTICSNCAVEHLPLFSLPWFVYNA